MDSKVCRNCGLEKPVSGFYRKSERKDGLTSFCKDCCNAKNLAYKHSTPERLEAARARSRRVGRRRSKLRDHGSAVCRRTWRRRNPEKVAAQNLLNKAVARGDVVRMPCLLCGDLLVHGHHMDYARPLDVIWLCSTHHRWVHSAYWD